jgi:hypothetical protein
MAVMKKRLRKKLSKYLGKLVKKHGAETTLALVTNMVSALPANKATRKAAAAKAADKPVRTIVVRKRAAR